MDDSVTCVLFTQPPQSEDHHTLHNHAPTAYRSFSGIFCLPLMVLLLLLWCVSIFLDASFMQPFRATITLVGCTLLVCLLWCPVFISKQDDKRLYLAGMLDWA